MLTFLQLTKKLYPLENFRKLDLHSDNKKEIHVDLILYSVYVRSTCILTCYNQTRFYTH